MEVICSEVLGFCFGVRRAVELAQKALIENKNKKVYSLGPLIHNKTVLSNFENQGLIILEENNIDSIEDESVVIIRAHGVSPVIIKKLENKNCTLINATCPKVRASQIYVEKRHDYTIFFTGDSNHGEVKGIEGYSDYRFELIQSAEDAQKLEIDNNGKNVLLSQTTFSQSQFEEIKKILLEKNPDIEIINTICSATKERQDALINLCKKTDGVIVIGGRNSANTNRLFQLAQEHSDKALLIENENEITEDFYDMEVVGITAGASTPDEVIDLVVKNLKYHGCKE